MRFIHYRLDHAFLSRNLALINTLDGARDRHLEPYSLGFFKSYWLGMRVVNDPFKDGVLRALCRAA